MALHARYTIEFTKGKTAQDLSGDRVLQFAVVRAIEVIGEAAKSIPDEVRALAPEIPWKQVTAMRDKLIHHYFGVEIDVVWRTIQEDIPALIVSLDRLTDQLARPKA